MSKKLQVTILLGAGALLIGVGSYITPQQQADIIMNSFDFEIEAIKTTSTTTQFYYTTLRESTTTDDYKVVREEGIVTIDNVGYKMCLDGIYGTSTKEFCNEFQENQLELNKQWFLEGELGRLKMLKYK